MCRKLSIQSNLIIALVVIVTACQMRQQPAATLLSTMQAHYYQWHDSLNESFVNADPLLPIDSAFLRIAQCVQDPHLSLMNTRSKTTLSWPGPTVSENFEVDTADGLPHSLSYLRLPSFTTSDSTAFSNFVESNARQLTLKPTGTLVIDLRGNNGGHFWAFFASLLPVLRDGIYGSFRIGKETHPWIVRGNAVYQGPQLVYSLKINVVKWQPEKIICLADGHTASSAEALLIALRSLGPQVVVCGKATYGATSVVKDFPLTADWKLHLPVGWFCNSAGQPITGRIYPDSTVKETLCL